MLASGHLLLHFKLKRFEMFEGGAIDHFGVGSWHLSAGMIGGGIDEHVEESEEIEVGYARDDVVEGYRVVGWRGRVERTLDSAGVAARATKGRSLRAALLDTTRVVR